MTSLALRTRVLGRKRYFEAMGVLSRRRQLAILGVPAFAAFGYLWVILWFAAHQRDFQYTPGGTQAAPDTVGLNVTGREPTVVVAVAVPQNDGVG
jgi:hypothetical protein